MPAPQIARLIARILGARSTPTEEVPVVVSRLRDAFARLGQDEAAAPAGETPAARALRELAVAVDGSEAAAKPAPRRSAGRPRRRAGSEEVAAEPTAPPPAAPRLMRRAEVAPAEPEIPEVLQSPPEARRRGVVRWFDARAGRGMLRVPGFAEDVPLEADALRQAGLSRLYKGQEIEATIIAGEGGQPRLVGLALPGRVAATGPLAKAGMMRRHAKPVVVEMKRDGLRRAAARIEAEHLLGHRQNRPLGAD
ncbi:MAG TPA: hypothetical protein VFA50_21330 [Stellaceae bacterium]|nr:hypothetical protein [Stellaceae bacterium]